MSSSHSRTSGARIARWGLIVATLLSACRGSTEPEQNAPLPAALSVSTVVSGLESPVHLTAPPGDTRLFIVEQAGRIRVLKNGELRSTPFLDIRSKVASGGELGLLGLAFHPAYAQNGFFYVYYTDVNGVSRVERYRATPTADVANANSASLLLTTGQPALKHVGGMLQFGPDGMLWVGIGDGGTGGDIEHRAQRLNTLFGKLLRIDVDRASPYAIPPDNPFQSIGGARGEIWAFGLRNPWRYAFDRQTGLLYVADVGENAWEEVHVVQTGRAGVNYGWNVMEGNHCFPADPCDTTGLDIPVLEYGHSEGCSITGGFVYRGSAIPGIRGHYFYSDFCRGFLKSFRYANGEATEKRTWSVGSLGNVVSFGEDSARELYIVSANGFVYRLEPPIEAMAKR